jgi:hypothetical protein
MKCPHCGIHFHDNWDEESFTRNSRWLQAQHKDARLKWYYRSAQYPGATCGDVTIEVAYKLDEAVEAGWRQIYPIGANRGPVPTEVPSMIAQD